MTASDFRTARHALGLTWKGAAERIGVNWRTVARWESGESPIPGPAANLISEWLERA